MARPGIPPRFLLDINPTLLTCTHPQDQRLVEEAQEMIAHSNRYLAPAEETLPFLPGNGFSTGFSV